MIRNFVLEGANAPGNAASCTLTGARPGRQTFRNAYADGAQCFYFMDDGTNWETGIASVHYGTPNSISRDTVIANSANTTNRINFTGALDVYNEVPGERMGYRDPTGVFRVPGAFFDPNAGGVPIGAGMLYWASTLPAGWLWANGSNVSRVTYARLFALYGTTHGAGDGASTFTLPDMRARFPLGTDGFGGAAASGRLPFGWGSSLNYPVGEWALQQHVHGLNWSDPGHAHGVSDPSHTHGVNDPQHSHVYLDWSVGGGGGSVGAGIGAGDIVRQTGFAPTNIGLFQANTGISIGAAGTGISASIQTAGAGNWQNIPPGLTTNFIIYSGAVV